MYVNSYKNAKLTSSTNSCQDGVPLKFPAAAVFRAFRLRPPETLATSRTTQKITVVQVVVPAAVSAFLQGTQQRCKLLPTLQ